MKAAADPANDGQIIAKASNVSGWQLKTSHDTGPQTFGVAVARANNAFAQRYSTTVRSLNVCVHRRGSYNAAARTLDIYVNGVLDNGTVKRDNSDETGNSHGEREYWATKRRVLF